LDEALGVRDKNQLAGLVHGRGQTGARFVDALPLRQGQLGPADRLAEVLDQCLPFGENRSAVPSGLQRVQTARQYGRKFLVFFVD
jgi:hypothetical protein